MAEMAALLHDVDVIVAGDTEAAFAARTNTPDTIPIVVIITGDVPRAVGPIPPEAGGRVTGQTHATSPDPGEVRLCILQSLFTANGRTLTRVAAIWNENNAGPHKSFTLLDAAATRIGITLVPIPVHDDDFTHGGRNLDKRVQDAAPDAVVSIDDPASFTHEDEILKATRGNRLPAVYDPPSTARHKDGLVAWGDDIEHEIDDALKIIDEVVTRLPDWQNAPANNPFPPVFSHPRSKITVNVREAGRLGLPTIPTEPCLGVEWERV
jgi:hypothetical protein